MAKSAGGGGRAGRSRSISTANNSGFRLGDRIEIQSRELGFTGVITKINPGSVKLQNSWGQVSKPIAINKLTGGTLSRTSRGRFQTFQLR